MTDETTLPRRSDDVFRTKSRRAVDQAHSSAPRDRVITIYYPSFPNYRLSILREISILRPKIRVLGGTVGRKALTPLNAADLSLLEELPTKELLGWSWNPGAFWACTCREAEVVVLGPATRSATTWSVLIARRLLGRRTILWGNCGKPGDRGLKRIAQEVMNRLSTHLMVYGRSEAESATELGTRRSKVTIIGNATRSLSELTGIMQASVPTFAERNAAARRSTVVLAYVGRLNPSKGVDQLIRAAQELTRRGTPASVLVIGAGPDQKSLMELAAELRIEARFTGPVHDPITLRRLLNETTIIVGPVEVGLMAIDALIHDAPVLVPDNPRHNGPEIEALQPGLNSLVFTPGSPMTIAAAVEKWIDLVPNIEPEEAAKARVRSLQRWTAEVVARRICEVISYEQAIRPRRRQSMERPAPREAQEPVQGIRRGPGSR